MLILIYLSLIMFIFSFRFFFWLIIIEILTLVIIRYLRKKSGLTTFVCSILVLGACEVGTALRIIVKVSRFSGLEKIRKLRCEGF